MSQYIDAKQLASDAKFYESYSRFLDDKQRYETWDESVARVMDMHRTKFKDKMTPELSKWIDEAEEAYRDKVFLGAQRALQYGGEQLLKHQFRLYNCFDVNTRFVTSEGVKSFSDFQDGDTVTVPTHTGSWKRAVVRNYGKDSLYEIVVVRKGTKHIHRATRNHRWILSDGTVTDKLNVGDHLIHTPNTFGVFDYDTASTEEKLYWCYGMVYGDGTITTTGHSVVRLCGNDVKYVYRFEELGFKTSSPSSLKGDVFVYTGTYQKTLPDLTVDSPELVRAFVAGYLDADGAKNQTSNGGKKFKGIQATGLQSIEFIRKAFPVAGVYIRNEEDFTGQVTNFTGPDGRPYTVRFTTNDNDSSRYNPAWRVESITEIEGEHEVWCLEVEDDHSFILEDGIVTGNCTSSHADRVAFFGEYFYIALCGAGVGFSVQKHHVAKLPKIMPRLKQAKTHVIEDSIEGWGTALDVLMSSFFEDGGKHPEYQGRKVFFDKTKIRGKGSFISGGFKAPGPDPLMTALNKIENLLTEISIQKRQMKPIEVYDVVMFAADAVISGGIRRAATICLFSLDDEEMLNAKTGNWLDINPQRGRSNNSAVILRKDLDKRAFTDIFWRIKEFGEPGFFFTDDLEIATNPCVEIGMYPVWHHEDNTKESGFQGCNLTEINGAKCNSKKDFLRACKYAAIVGTLQAAYTDFKFVSDVTKKIFDREALLGVSLTGWMNNPDVLLNPETLREGAQTVLYWNQVVADIIGINYAARSTCVKPAGNASVLLMTAPGVHGEHSDWTLRYVQMNKDLEVAKLIKKINPEMVEESVWSSGKTDYNIAFPFIAKKGSKFKSEMLGTKQLDIIKLIQENWVMAGVRPELCVNKAAMHNVSNTVLVDDWDKVRDYVYDNRNVFTGISFLAMSGDKDYQQAPYTSVYDEKKLVEMYGPAAIFAAGLIVDGISAFNGSLWNACSTALGIGEDLSDDYLYNALLKRDCVRRFFKFADNYFQGNAKMAEYCLKDAHLLHKWHKIQKSYKDINWLEELTTKEWTDVDSMGAIACSAKGCEI